MAANPPTSNATKRCSSVWEIVGVVEDVREGPLDMEAKPTEYFPMNRSQDHSFSLAVRNIITRPGEDASPASEQAKRDRRETRHIGRGDPGPAQVMLVSKPELHYVRVDGKPEVTGRNATKAFWAHRKTELIKYDV